MTRYWVELSGENPGLALAEVEGAVRAVGGSLCNDPDPTTVSPLAPIELGDPSLLAPLASRLGLARRIFSEAASGPVDRGELAFAAAGAEGKSAEFRLFGGHGGRLDNPLALRWAAAYVRGGGRIDLTHPDRRYRVRPTSETDGTAYLERARVDRRAYGHRTMPRLPFQRPVSLPPRRARVVVNLASVKPGDRVIDPFVGTGALLLEAGLLGAKISGVDRDPEMVRGALKNLSAVGVEADRLSVGDAGETFPSDRGRWDALVTDPPYGRASGSGGEDPAALLARVLPRWAARVRPRGRVAVVVPGGADPLDEPWRRIVSVSDRVHRSLTREFRVYERATA